MESSTEFLSCFRALKGIVDAHVLSEADRAKLLEVEIEAEKNAFMGLGKTYNSGIREILACPVVILGLTNMEFEWGCQQSHMVLKKDDTVVGEEVWGESDIQELKKRPDVWFLHQNFVIYKARVDFPKDLMRNRCTFELPALALEQEITGLPSESECMICYPSTVGDVHLKNTFCEGKDEKGTGTVLFGIRECA